METHPQHPLPPSSQAVNHFFIDSTNRPLKVFVEASEVVKRPRIVRILKNGGATVVEDIAEANIILVTPGTKSATELGVSWYGEKTFLDTDWVYESQRRKRPYLEDEDWGGFVAPEGGRSEIGTTEKESQLPTPRETPSETKVPQSGFVMQNEQQQTQPVPSQYMQAPLPAPPPSFQQQQMTQMTNGNFQMGGVGQGPQVVLPAELYTHLLGIAQQSQLAGIAQLPPSTQPTQLYPPGYQPPIGAPYPPFVLPYQPMILTQQPPPLSVGSPSHHDQVHSSATPETHVHMRRNRSISDSMDEDEGASYSKKPRSAGHVPSSSKKKIKQEGDRRLSQHRRESGSYDGHYLPYQEESPPPPTQPSRRSAEASKLFVDEYGRQYRFFVQVDVRNRKDLADAVRKHGGVMEAEVANADFVILAHPSHKSYKHWLEESRRCKKTPVKPQWVMDCVDKNAILGTKHYMYEDAIVPKRRGRPSNYGQGYVNSLCSEPEVEEVEGEEEVADDECIPGPSKKRKIQAESKVKKEKTKVEKTSKAKSMGEGTPAKKMKKVTASTVRTPSEGKKKAQSPPPPNGRWMPSPPPPTRVVEHTNGKNLYTKEDKDYCDEYIPILLARDSSMSHAEIAGKLHAKMPHHPIKSWQTHVTSNCRERIEQARRRAQIQNRKAAASQQAGPSQTVKSVTPPPSAPSSHLTSSGSTRTDRIHILATFFVAGRADDLKDSEVWQTLSQEHPSISAAEWERFWNDNHDSICAEIERRNKLQNEREGAKTEPA